MNEVKAVPLLYFKAVTANVTAVLINKDYRGNVRI